MNKEQKLHLIREKVCNCTKCPALVENRIQTVFGEGNPNSPVVFLGEAPGQNEAEQGRPFVGRSGQLLDNILSSVGFKREDIYILNILKCRPPKNRTPLPEEADNCKPFLLLQLKVINPKIIVCLGSCAAQNLLQTQEKISSLRTGWHMYDGRKVLCTFHPSYALRGGNAVKQEIWNDMKKLVTELNSDSQV